MRWLRSQPRVTITLDRRVIANSVADTDIAGVADEALLVLDRLVASVPIQRPQSRHVRVNLAAAAVLWPGFGFVVGAGGSPALVVTAAVAAVVPLPALLRSQA